MAAPDKALIVTVQVPTLDPGRDSPWHGEVGTGCAVDNGLILTSRHLVQPENRNHAHPIKVRWYALRHRLPGFGWVDLDPDDEQAIRRVGEGDLDAALLVCPRPEALRDIQCYHIAADPPTQPIECEGVGFPRARELRGKAKHADFRGTVLTPALGQRFLTVESTVAPARQADWKGVSGMPLLHRGTIVGIVKTVTADYQNRVLEAVPAYLLRADEGFAQALATAPAPRFADRARDLMIRALERSETATRALARACGIEGPALADCRKALAGWALSRSAEGDPFDTLAKRALKVKRELQDRGDDRSAEAVVKFVLAALPAAAKATEVPDLGPLGRGAEAAPIPLCKSTLALAEILMAAADLRGPGFHRLADDRDEPIGLGCVRHVLETGRDPGGDQRLRDLTTGLVHFCESELTETLDQALFNQLRCEIPAHLRGPDPGPELSAELEQKLIDRIRRILEARADAYLPREGRFTYYVLADSPAGPADARRAPVRQEVLEKIARRFPYLAVLAAAPCDDPWSEIASILSPELLGSLLCLKRTDR